MQYVINQRGFYIVETNESLIVKRTQNKAEAKRLNEKDARMLAAYLMNATIELADRS
jgi:hypothetical protein